MGKRRYSYTTQEAYKNYKQVLSKSALPILNEQEYRKVVLCLSKAIMEFLKEGKRLYTPVGYFHFLKHKRKKPKIDQFNSQKYNKKVYFTNMHTGGYAVFLQYSRIIRPAFAESKYWKFKLTRWNKRSRTGGIAKLLKEDSSAIYRFNDLHVK